MKIRIAILGSTGSIGETLLKIIFNNKKKFKIELLSANKNYKKIFKQAEKFNVKNLIITNKKYFEIAKLKNKNNKFKIYNNFNSLEQIFSKKIDYTMSSIVGLGGLEPTFKIIKFTRKIAIANKETIICAWNLIKKELNKHNTKFVPVDSEHFSMWYALKNNSILNLEKVFLTASGGPLLNEPINKSRNYKINKIIKHPNWNMGPKISVDSSTMINKVFEIIEAKKIFNLDYKQLSILIHPKSYVHAILKFKDGMIKLIAHETTMYIPIFNTLTNSNQISVNTKKTNIYKLNNLNFSNVNTLKYPLTKIIKLLPTKDSLYETVLVSVNDEYVNLFLKNKISYSSLVKNLIKFIQKKEYIKYKHIEPKKINDILNLNYQIKSKINQYVIKN